MPPKPKIAAMIEITRNNKASRNMERIRSYGPFRDMASNTDGMR